MKVSLNIVKQLTGLDLPDTGALVERINQRLGGVEEVIDVAGKYKDARIVRVIECEKHPNADKLSVCKIDAGTGELVQVVCGAPNVHADMWAVWLPPESVVPSTYGTDEPFRLGARELRGVMSQGMLAAADELAIGSDHTGIVELTDYDLPPAARHPELDSGSSEAAASSLVAGASFAEVFGLDDTVIEIENKMFTHRPDLFGQLGVAREINAILQDEASASEAIDNRFENPDWYWLHPEFDHANGLELNVFNDTPDASPRFMAVAISSVEIKPSPLWLQCRLVALGAKPVSNVVDLTNYVMLMTAQPTHAYDYDKIRGHKIGVRMANEGESIRLLNDKTYELTTSDVVIADSEGAIGLAGVMGGLNSEVTDQTTSIVLEVANFDMYKIRKTSMRYGLFTDAVTRFNKGQSPLQTDRVAKRLLDLLPGKQASPVYDLPDRSNELDEVSVHGEVLFSADFINQRLGTEFTADQIGNILRPVNFATYLTDDERLLSSTAPYWRTDIELPEDIVEEVGRLYGFDRLTRELPTRAMRAQSRNQARVVKQLVRESLARQGASEVLTYSFVHEKTLTRAGQDPSIAFRLSNALSPDLQYYRLTVLPSLLDKVHQNIRAGHDEFVLFEIGKGHNKQFYETDSGLPSETSFIDAVYASQDEKAGAPYYRMKHIVEQLARELSFDITFVPITSELSSAVTSPFEQSRSAMIMSSSNVLVGIVGELKQTVVKNFKLPAYSAAMSLDTRVIETLYAAASVRYRRLNRYPGISRDVSIKTSTDTSFSQIETVLRDCLAQSSYCVDLLPVARYQSTDDVAHVSTTFHIELKSDEGTLSDQDINPLFEKIEKFVAEKINGKIV